MGGGYGNQNQGINQGIGLYGSNNNNVGLYGAQQGPGMNMGGYGNQVNQGGYNPQGQQGGIGMYGNHHQGPPSQGSLYNQGPYDNYGVGGPNRGYGGPPLQGGYGSNNQRGYGNNQHLMNNQGGGYNSGLPNQHTPGRGDAPLSGVMSGGGGIPPPQAQQQRGHASLSSSNAPNDGLSGPYPPSFPAGGSGGGVPGQQPQGAAGGGNAYHSGPGWDQLPRWQASGAGQLSYGQGGAGAGNSAGYGSGGAAAMNAGSVGGAPTSGYGTTGGGGGVGHSAASSFPHYPRPPAEYQSAGSYDQYQGPSGYQGPGGGGTSSYNNNHGGGGAYGTANGGASDTNLSGPYPPSFQAGNTGYEATTAAGGTGALSSLLQAPYNPEHAARTGKYPSILGGRPENNVGPPEPAALADRSMSSSGMLGGEGDHDSVAGSIPEGPGLPEGSGLKIEESGSKKSSSGSLVADANSSNGPTSTPVSTEPEEDGDGAEAGGPPKKHIPEFVPPSERERGEGVLPGAPILPKRIIPDPSEYENDNRGGSNFRGSSYNGIPIPSAHDSQAKKREWLLSMNATLDATPIGQLDPNALPLSTIMNGWAKQKSSEGARNVEMWLDRVHQEYKNDNPSVYPTARMYTMAVDAWAKSNGGAPAARRAEALLERMDRLYREGEGRHEALKPTTGIFNAVINVSFSNQHERLVSNCQFLYFKLDMSLNTSFRLYLFSSPPMNYTGMGPFS